MISYASSKAFLNTVVTSLRALAHRCSSLSNINGIHLHNAKASLDGIEATTVLPAYIEFSSIADGTRVKSLRTKSADREVREVVRAVERGGEGICLPMGLKVRFVVSYVGLDNRDPDGP
jgi:hypothetical protein